MKKIAISTTLPLEILLNTGHQIVDLNNRFVLSPKASEWLQNAERSGFPKSLCAWIKGLHGACLAEKPDLFIAVTEGDCSNTKGLNNILAHKGIPVISFGYPQDNTLENVEKSLRDFATVLKVEWNDVVKTWEALKSIRSLGVELDKLTYETNQVSGFENHLWLVSFSDFDGNLENFEDRLKTFLEEVKGREPMTQPIRLGYVGVPPMTGDLYGYTESFGARIVYNEVQRQFSMPQALEVESIVHQYRDYTYPYDLSMRIADIEKAIQERKLDGIIHYTQAFCHRALDDIVLKDVLKCPVLTIEGDQGTTLDGRTKLRIEAFIDLLKEEKQIWE